MENKSNEKSDGRCKLCAKLNGLLFYMSIGKVLVTASITLFAVLVLYVCKAYIRTILLWLERQDSAIVAATILILFVIVSFPIGLGYIVLVTAAGYLFDVRNGLMLSMAGANVGLFVAHNAIKMLGNHSRIKKFTEMEMAKAIARVISGPLSFKIILCARVTPIPFGFQNTIFALSNVNCKLYHLASFIGLLPAQIIATTVGSTLKSMLDVFENRELSTTAYVFITLQLIIGVSVMAWVTAKARKELIKVLDEANAKYGLNGSFNVV